MFAVDYTLRDVFFRGRRDGWLLFCEMLCCNDVIL